MNDSLYQPARGERSTLRLASAVALWALVVLFGCIPTEGGGGGGVSGTVMGQPFDMYGGVAEPAGSGYLITLTDSSLYDCVSTPEGDYLQIVWEVSDEGSYSAVGNVTFSSVEGNFVPSESASSGSVSVSSIDLAASTITGSINASGPESSVTGTFTVEICD